MKRRIFSMKMTRLFKCYSVLIGIFLIFVANPIYGQQKSDTDTTGAQTNQEQLFKIQEAMIENLKDKIPAEKLNEIEKIKGKGFSEKQLSVTLKGMDFDDDEIETILNHVGAHLNFVEKIRNLRPVILSMDTTTGEILKKENEQKSAQKKEEKERITKELALLSDCDVRRVSHRP